MAEKKPVHFIDFVSLPLLLSALTLLAFWQWPKETSRGFMQMTAFIDRLQQPSPKQTNPAGRPDSPNTMEGPGRRLSWSNNVVLDEKTIESHQRIAAELATDSEREARTRFCREYQAAYIDDPSSENKASMEAACMGLTQ